MSQDKAGALSTLEQQLLYLGFETRFRSELREYMKKERKDINKKRHVTRQEEKRD